MTIDVLFDWWMRVIPAQTQKADAHKAIFAALMALDQQKQLEDMDPIDRPLLETD